MVPSYGQKTKKLTTKKVWSYRHMSEHPDSFVSRKHVGKSKKTKNKSKTSDKKEQNTKYKEAEHVSQKNPKALCRQGGLLSEGRG